MPSMQIHGIVVKYAFCTDSDCTFYGVVSVQRLKALMTTYSVPKACAQLKLSPDNQTEL